MCEALLKLPAWHVWLILAILALEAYLGRKRLGGAGSTIGVLWLAFCMFLAIMFHRTKGNRDERNGNSGN